MAKKKQAGTIARNKKASFDYALEDRFTAGLVLTGPEIKSIRSGNVRINEAYCFFDEEVLKIKGMYIGEFKNAGYAEQDPHRVKLLLLNKNELKKIQSRINEKGYSLVPTALFISDKGYAKLELALGKGKKHFDKRESLKSKDIDREIREY